ncbi:E3 ubiquitin-protein ligase RNF180 isoform X2 [Xenopus laevis]|uniref:E3 ubiquitin-protein ligase RNF180 n=1 Tax=Xenopus laevis TaxID=8355 RepID=A0A8J0U675_XENLA|nr:E3 ubiquitin-protein ligase RNF180 isoform X2 [Xenopus laevis]
MSREELSAPLRCRKCRKCVADSDSFIKDQAWGFNHDSSDNQNSCTIWHMDVGTVPDWISRLIEKAHWTTGKLNCPVCGARLGAFNFTGNSKCSCGQIAVLYLCKSKIDYEAALPLRILKPHVKIVPNSKEQSACKKELKRKLIHGLVERHSHKNLTMDKSQQAMGRLAEALCLEVHWSKQFEVRRTKITSFRSENTKAKCSQYICHRKSKSLDFVFFENSSDIYNSIAFSNRQAAGGCLNVCSGTSSQLLSVCNRFGNDNTQIRLIKGEQTQDRCITGAENVLAVQLCSSPQRNSDHAPTSTNNMAPESTVREDISQIPPVDTVPTLNPPPPSSSLVAVNQRLKKREINKLKSLRRKQRKREKWLQQQTAKVNDSTDEENEHIMEKESYICAVCLDIYFNPYMCNPCQHIFCEPCLRMIAKDNPTKTLCPLCRTTIARVCFQSDLNKSSLAFFPNEYLKRKECFQRANYSKWPLPNSNRLFRGFGEDT